MGTQRRTGTGKLAQQVAAEVEAEIVRTEWPVGAVLGSEPDLLARFEVSRAVLREAVRILEDRGVAEMRKGRGGGLTVAAPKISSLVRSAALHLDYAGATPEDLVEARLGLEMAALELAFDHMDDGGLVALETHMAQEQATLASRGRATHANAFHGLLVRLSHNPVLVLCAEVTLELQHAHQHTVWSDDQVPLAVARRSVQAHQDIVDAILAGNRTEAAHALRDHLGGLAGGRATSLCRHPAPIGHQSAL